MWYVNGNVEVIALNQGVVTTLVSGVHDFIFIYKKVHLEINLDTSLRRAYKNSYERTIT
jgi:hypothetical protein